MISFRLSSVQSRVAVTAQRLKTHRVFQEAQIRAANASQSMGSAPHFAEETLPAFARGGCTTLSTYQAFVLEIHQEHFNVPVVMFN